MKRTPLSQQAYERIKQQIVTLELAPGTVIDEASLKEELGLGRTPIREALLRLSIERLVVIMPRRGMFVSDIKLTELQQLFEVRLAMESLAARYAAQRGTEEHWRQMEQVLSHSIENGTHPDNEALVHMDEVCHHIIYDAAGNEFLQDSLVTMYARSQRLWHFLLANLADMREAVMEHKRIMEALRAGDEDRAAGLMEKHIRAFQEEIQLVMLGTST